MPNILMDFSTKSSILMLDEANNQQIHGSVCTKKKKIPEHEGIVLYEFTSLNYFIQYIFLFCLVTTNSHTRTHTHAHTHTHTHTHTIYVIEISCRSCFYVVTVIFFIYL